MSRVATAWIVIALLSCACAGESPSTESAKDSSAGAPAPSNQAVQPAASATPAPPTAQPAPKVTTSSTPSQRSVALSPQTQVQPRAQTRPRTQTRPRGGAALSAQTQRRGAPLSAQTQPRDAAPLSSQTRPGSAVPVDLEPPPGSPFPFSAEKLRRGVQAHVASRAALSSGWYHVEDATQNRSLPLQYLKAHERVLHVEGRGYLSVAEFGLRDRAGELYDIGFWMDAPDGKLRVIGVEIVAAPEKDGDGWTKALRMSLDNLGGVDVP